MAREDEFTKLIFKCYLLSKFVVKRYLKDSVKSLRFVVGKTPIS